MRSAMTAMAATVSALFFLSALSGAVDAQIYKYQRSDGTWVFTDNPARLPEDVEVLEGVANGRPPVGRDLREHLYAKFNPRNEIEKAALATVVVESAVGRGAGFFVSEDGHILTNRHVIRTPEGRKKQIRARNDRMEMKIDQYEKQFAREQERIDAAMAELEGLKGRIYPKTYADRKKTYERWQAELDRKKAAFSEEVAKVRTQAEDEAYKDRMANLDRSFTVVLADRTALQAGLVAVSDRMDLALLQLDGHRTPFLAPAEPYQVPTGGRVYAIGNPAALHHSVAQGILSGYEQGYIKTDAKIYPGNSGGPLVSERGEVLGVNTFKKLTYRYEGLGFAIPVHAALDEFSRHLAGAGSRSP